MAKEIAKLSAVFDAHVRTEAAGPKLILRLDRQRWTPELAARVKIIAGETPVGAYHMRATLYDSAMEMQKLPGIRTAHYSEESNAFIVAFDKAKATPELDASLKDLAGGERILYAPVGAAK